MIRPTSVGKHSSRYGEGSWHHVLFSDCIYPNTRRQHDPPKSRTIYQLTRRHTPEDLNLRHHHCYSLQSNNILAKFMKHHAMQTYGSAGVSFTKGYTNSGAPGHPNDYILYGGAEQFRPLLQFLSPLSSHAPNRKCQITARLTLYSKIIVPQYAS